ncbi:MAG: methylated-DNA--[protein]-cysteine S-methyltransferase [Eubacterium sp.]|nr:methylated-DNA--[protein]-cysteine S-methyltransferase [Eubacterium sp.]
MYTLTFEIPNTPHTLTAYSDGKYLTALAFDCTETDNPDAVCYDTAKQLGEYFAGRRKSFDLPYTLDGCKSAFFREVMGATCRIPYGDTASYADVARAAGHIGAARAVGTALKKNPLPIIIPCHRILPAGGGVGSYFGGRLNDVKEYLLRLEKII